MKYLYDMPDLDLAIDWLKWTKEHMPWITSRPEKYAHAIKIIRDDLNCDIKQVRSIYDFIKRHAFWSENALSPVGITKMRTNGREPKIVFILRDMKKFSINKPMNIAKKIDMELLDESRGNDEHIINVQKDSSQKLARF